MLVTTFFSLVFKELYIKRTHLASTDVVKGVVSCPCQLQRKETF